MNRESGSGSLTVAGLFAGIGGIELGLHAAGHRTALLCEYEPGAASVLRAGFPDVALFPDVRELRSIPRVDLLAAGFPCQDLSQAGRTAGIEGRNSGLVGHVFRLLDERKRSGPTWLMLENVPFMLQLDSGRAMRYLVDELDRRGYAWAYRVVDSRSFGLPQRRQRVILLASKQEDPRQVLFADEAPHSEPEFHRGAYCGFYWTEGLRGVGWAVEAVPTLKGGSTIGIPSPPAIWASDTGEFFTPDIADCERLQGFEAGWTIPSTQLPGMRSSHRWKLVGNAVSVPVAEWVGQRLASPGACLAKSGPLARETRWPKAAWGYRGSAFSVDATMWPRHEQRLPLRDFLQFRSKPLSAKAASGFLGRARSGSLRFQEGFLDDLESHIARMRKGAA